MAVRLGKKEAELHLVRLYTHIVLLFYIFFNNKNKVRLYTHIRPVGANCQALHHWGGPQENAGVQKPSTDIGIVVFLLHIPCHHHQ